MKTQHPGLRTAVTLGLMTEAAADDLDAWAEELAKKLAAGEITQGQVDRAICDRLLSDLARRGQG